MFTGKGKMKNQKSGIVLEIMWNLQNILWREAKQKQQNEKTQRIYTIITPCQVLKLHGINMNLSNDSTYICDLFSLNNTILIPSHSIGLSCDDALFISHSCDGHTMDTFRKQSISIFNTLWLKIAMETNLTNTGL